MTLTTSNEQQAIATALAGWAAARRVRELVRSDLDTGEASWRPLWGELAEFGVFAAGVDEAAGGAGGTFDDTAAILAACGGELVPGPLGASAAVAAALARQGSPLAEDLLAGDRAAVVPAAAVAAGVPLVVHDGVVDLGPVPGFVDDALIVAPLEVDGLTGWFVIPGPRVRRAVRGEVPGPDAPGQTAAVDGTAAAVEVVLEGVEAAGLIRIDDGPALHAMLIAGVVAYQAGVARAVLDMAVQYAKVRTQFGVPIGSFQAIKHLCADMLCRAEQLSAAAWDLAAAIDAGERAQRELSMLAAAVLTAELPLANAKDAIQILGGIGFTFEHDAHLYLRSALSARIHLAGGAPAREALAALGRSGARREFAVDLAAVEHRRGEIAALVAGIAAAPDDRQRAELAAAGLLMPHWPEPYGVGADPALQLLIDAELDRAGVRRPDLVIAGWALPTILEHGTAAQREKFIAPTLAGDIVWCQLFSEPEAGSDLASLRTRAERVDGGWKLTGQKIWTSAAAQAHWGVALARTDPQAPKHRGITYFLIDMTSPGIDVRPLREMTGRALFNEVFLDGVVVPDDCVVGEIDGGWRLARTTLANERVAMGGAGLGKEMDALLRQLERTGAVLDEAAQQRLGALIAEAHIGRVLDARTVAQRLSGTDPGVTSSVRKLIGAVHRQAVPEFALDLLGPAGLLPSVAGEQFLLNRCLSIAGGTTQVLKNAAAERILGLPRG